MIVASALTEAVKLHLLTEDWRSAFPAQADKHSNDLPRLSGPLQARKASAAQLCRHLCSRSHGDTAGALTFEIPKFTEILISSSPLEIPVKNSTSKRKKTIGTCYSANNLLVSNYQSYTAAQRYPGDRTYADVLI